MGRTTKRLMKTAAAVAAAESRRDREDRSEGC